MPPTFQMMNWKCPALIVDYVRFFESVPLEDVTTLEQCPELAQNNITTTASLSSVCHYSLRSMESLFDTAKASFFKDNWGK